MIEYPRATIAVLALALLAVTIFPDEAILIEFLLLPFFIGGAILSTWYLWRVYGRNPMGVVWRQIIGGLVTSLPFLLWVGYLVTARIAVELNLLGVAVPTVPVPSAGQSAPISGLLLILAITPSIRYALTVHRLGRSVAERSEGTDRDFR